MRILSLLPSATEIVFALGLGGDLVGVSHECDYPPEACSKPVVSTSGASHKSLSKEIHSRFSEHRHSSRSLYHIDQQLLRKFNPEVILTQELCTVCAVTVGQVRQAAQILAGPCQIVSLEPKNLRQILGTIETVGEITGRAAAARAVVSALERRITNIASAVSDVPTRPRVFCMEWMDPVMPGGHWIPEMVRLAGGMTTLGDENKPSRVIEWDELVEFSPDVIVVMSCGYKIARSMVEVDRLTTRSRWHELPAVSRNRVYVVDSPSYFSRPGPRIVTGLEILAQIIHPELFAGLIPAGGAVNVFWDNCVRRVVELT